MAIFIVASAGQNPGLMESIAIRRVGNFIQIAEGQWLVAADMTAQQLSDELGITSGSMGNSIFVAALSSYYGRHRPEVWEWIRVKWQGGPHGG